MKEAKPKLKSVEMTKREQVTQEILGCRDEAGIVKPEDVVKWARKNPDSHLHSLLEWDDKKAAESFRCEQVRHIMFHYVRDENGHPRMVSLSSEWKEGGGYRLKGEVLKNNLLRKALVKQKLADLRGGIDSIESLGLNELKDVVSSFRRAEKQFRDGTIKRAA